MTYCYKKINSPLGLLTLVASDRGLVAILWPNENPQRVRLPPLSEDKQHPLLQETEYQLSAYFSGTLQQFRVSLDWVGTAFQKSVWMALMTIPFGETCSYGDIAHKIIHPNAVRAVGAAIGKNPVSIIVPCHRVIGANGKLTGFAGGLAAKTFLLENEKQKIRTCL